MPRHTTSVLPAPLTHSLAHSFIPALTYATRKAFTHMSSQWSFFLSPHFSKGSLALKGNLLFLLQEFSSSFFLLSSKTQHTMNAVSMTMGHIVCEKGIFFQYLGQLIYTHTHTHTHTYKHTEGICKERS